MNCLHYMRHAPLTATLALAALVLFVPAANAQNIVTNGDFETGNLQGWVLTGGDGGGFSTVGNDGSFVYINGEVSATPSTLTQTLTTVPGGSYTFSFIVKPNSDTVTEADNGFSARFNGVEVFSFTNNAGTAFFSQSFDVTATTTSTDISFTGYNSPDVFALDNVSVAAAVVPEAGTFALVLPALGILGAVVVRRRK